MSIFIGHFEVRNIDGAKWLKIFYHNSTGAVFFEKISISNEALFTNQKQKFSLLKLLPIINKYESDWFEFKLEYPEQNGYIQWKQNLSPLDTYQVRSGNIENFIYQPLFSTWKEDVFGGLVQATVYKETFLTGSATIPSWHYAIGAYNSWINYDTFPGTAKQIETAPATSIFTVHEAILWIRIKDNSIPFVHLCTQNVFSLRFLVTPFIFVQLVKD